MKDFKVGDKVFSTDNGCGTVTEISSESIPYKVHVLFADSKHNYYCEDGKRILSDKYPSLFHIDEAFKLFPMWLEEAEIIDKEIRYGLFDTRDKRWFTAETLESPQIDNPPFKWVEICIPTKRRIIREKQ